MGFQVLVRYRSRHESLVILLAAGVLGLLPVVVCLRDPRATPASLLMGLILGLPLFVLSLWSLTFMEALVLSEDGTTLALFQRTCRGRRRFDIPCSDLEWMGFDGHALGIGLKSGGRLELAVESPLKTDGILRDLAGRLEVRYTSLFDYRPEPSSFGISP